MERRKYILAVGRVDAHVYRITLPSTHEKTTSTRVQGQRLRNQRQAPDFFYVASGGQALGYDEGVPSPGE